MRSTLTPFTLSLVFLIAPIATAQTPLDSVFTYQGKLAAQRTTTTRQSE